MLLGILAEIYPEFMMSYSDRLVGLYVTALKTEVSCVELCVSNEDRDKLYTHTHTNMELIEFVIAILYIYLSL